MNLIVDTLLDAISQFKTAEANLASIVAKKIPYKDLFNSEEQDLLARLKLIYSNALGGFFVAFVCMAILCFGFNTPEAQSAKNYLFGVFFCIHSLRIIDNIYTMRQFKSKNIHYSAIVWRLSIGIALNSLIWTSYSFLFIADMQGIELTISAIILSALAGGTITMLAASTALSALFMSSLILPFVIVVFFHEQAYMHYLSYLGIIFWGVMLISARQVGAFLTEVLQLKGEKAHFIELMDIEKKEVLRINEALTTANLQLDRYANKLESEVDERTAEIFRLSNIDPLTNLSNRTAFSTHLKQAIHKAQGDEQYLLLFIDLNGFKDVNDGFGHKIGDEVLAQIAKRLESLRFFIAEEYLDIPDLDRPDLDRPDLDSPDFTVELSEINGANNGTRKPSNTDANLICRWGGDEFLFLSKYRTQACIDALVHAIQGQIQEPIKVASNNIALSASIGIAKYPCDSKVPSDLIQYADISMYHHKKYAVGDAVYFSLPLLKEFQQDQVIRDGLKGALRNNEFSLVFHPIIDTHNNEVWALEALIRWQHRGKNIPPDEFISIAEKSGHIVQIGSWVLIAACKEAVKWEYAPLPAVSVNVSSLQLLDNHFIDILKLALDESGLAPERLHLEITESVMLEKADITSSQLKQITDMGIHISIDDFGTGYSSLNQLQSMAFDTIKIDRSFLQSLNKKDITIISATKLIADEFQAITVAEGIETEEELAVLTRIGIRYIQGYLFAKPMSPEAISNWLQSYQTNKPLNKRPT